MKNMEAMLSSVLTRNDPKIVAPPPHPASSSATKELFRIVGMGVGVSFKLSILDLDDK